MPSLPSPLILGENGQGGVRLSTYARHGLLGLEYSVRAMLAGWLGRRPCPLLLCRWSTPTSIHHPAPKGEFGLGLPDAPRAQTEGKWRGV